VCPPPGTHAAGNQLAEEEEGLLGARGPNQRERENQEDILKFFFFCLNRGVSRRSPNLRELKDIPKLISSFLAPNNSE
jgi:hypothetical protein